MQGRWFAGLFCAAIASVSFAVANPITPVSQNRAVSAAASFSSSEESEFDSDADVASDFDAFNSTVDASIRLFDPNTGPGVQADAFQNSDIQAQTLFGEGNAGVANEDGTFNAEGEGETIFSLDFNLAGPGTYTLTGSLDASDALGGFAQAMVELIGPGGTIYTLTAEDGTLPIVAGGAILPGLYTLTVTAAALTNAELETADAAFDFSFTFIPEPAAAWALLAAGLLVGRRRRP